MITSAWTPLLGYGEDKMGIKERVLALQAWFLSI